jgi:hypothetical protein
MYFINLFFQSHKQEPLYFIMLKYIIKITFLNSNQRQ